MTCKPRNDRRIICGCFSRRGRPHGRASRRAARIRTPISTATAHTIDKQAEQLRCWQFTRRRSRPSALDPDASRRLAGRIFVLLVPGSSRIARKRCQRRAMAGWRWR